jgi:hypothetical protein
MISTYTKGFSREKFAQIHQIFMMIPVGSQEYRRILIFFFLLSYLFCSQIWLNHLMDYCHFSYVTKKKKKKKKNPCNSTISTAFIPVVRVVIEYGPVKSHLLSHRLCPITCSSSPVTEKKNSPLPWLVFFQ